MRGLWNTVLKGGIIGATMIVPGVSGGTMAIILGIYDRLISAVSSFHKNVKENVLFLALFAIGAGCGFYLFATPVSWFLENFEFPTICFFVLIVLCGIPTIGKKSGVQKINFEALMYLIFGALLVTSISRLPSDVFQSMTNVGSRFWLRLFLSGTAAAGALILPGISFTHFLLILGLYESLLDAVRNIQLTFLIPLGLGVVVGVLSLSKLLEHLMEKYPKQTYLMILGFIIGSVSDMLAKYL